MIDIDLTHIVIGTCLSLVLVYFFASCKARLEVEEADDEDMYEDDE